MNIENSLKSIGLNYREIQVYLATLELGQSTVTPISKKSGFKRTYCYDILEELRKKKLVDYIEKNGRRRYFAEDPKKIENILKENLSSFQTQLPDLLSIYSKPGNKPRVRYFEGKEGVASIYDEMASTSRELLAIGSPAHIYKYLGEYFTPAFEKSLKNKIKIKELITRENQDFPKYYEKYKKPDQEARHLPANIQISTDMMIFNNKLALISYDEDIHAVVIESSSIVDTQKILFEIIWNQAKKFIDR